METGTSAVSHRQVAARAGVPLGSTTQYFATLDDLRDAAIAILVERYDAELARIDRALAGAQSPPRTAARMLHEWLSAGDLLRLETALYAGAIHDASLRPLALRWFDGFVAVLSQYTDPATAWQLAVFFDGATLHAVLNDAPPSLDALTATALKLWSSR
jgi:TetR/AcrR family transcriptional regulator, regulator of biofilm formation and stress response